MSSGLTLLERAHTALIQYPRFKELHEEIRLCHKVSQIAGEPQCMALEGCTGAGKSTLVKAYAADFPVVETEQGRCIPVLYMQVPSPVGIRDLASAALKRLGDPACDRGTRASMTIRLIGLIQDCGIRLVILDDFHHLIDRRTHHVLSEVSDWLKYLIKETGVPFLVVGIEGNVQAILESNPQLSRLFAAREILYPLAWDVSKPETLHEFSCFVEYATDKAMGKSLTHELPRTDLLYRLHVATDGIVGNLMNLLRVAAELAEMRHSPVIDLPVLSQAYVRRLQKHMKNRPDPFSEIVLPVSPPEKATPSKKRKRPTPSLQEVLKTR